jgi:aspartate aminotransferase-like enzyme
LKYRLLAPGPTPVPEFVLTAMANPIWHHRTPAFEATFKECRDGLNWLFQTEYDVLTLSCSGTGAFESAFQTLFSKGAKVITIGGGKFGERWGEMASALGLEAIRVPVEWGHPVDVNVVEDLLNEHDDIEGVVCVASETSTGVRHPYEEIGKLVKGRDDCLFLVDGITAVGVWDIKPERDHIDVIAAGSQKAMMLPPGLGFICLSDKAWKKAESIDQQAYYFNLLKERKAQAKNQTAYTPAVTLLTGLKESFRMMRAEGLEEIFARHARLARAVRAGVTGLGLSLFAKAPGDSVTSVVNPSEVAPNAIYSGLRERANVTIAGGQDHLKGKIFRIAHLGYYDELDIVTVMGALEIVLRQEGYTNFKNGQGVGAAIDILAEGFVKK